MSITTTNNNKGATYHDIYIIYYNLTTTYYPNVAKSNTTQFYTLSKSKGMFGTPVTTLECNNSLFLMAKVAKNVQYTPGY